MSIEIIKRVLKDYREILNPRNKTIGSVLKHHRREQGLTLEETSLGTCSVSYLCKVENNQLIPSDKILSQLLKKLNIKEDVFKKEEKDTKFIDIILDHGYVPTKLRNEAKDKNDYQSKLIDFAYTILNLEDYQLGYQKNADLFEYYIFFNDDELAFYMYLLMCKKYLREQYEEVILIHNEVKTVHDNRNILLKAQVLALKSYYRLERFGEATAFLNDIMNELYLYNKREDISKIFQYELATFARFNETADLQEEIDLLKGKLDINFDFIWFKHYFYYKKDYKEALKYISKIYDENQHFFIYYLITLDKLGKEDVLRNIYEENPFPNLKTSYKLVYRYIYIKYFDPDKYDDAKYELNKTSALTNEFFVVKYIFNELLKYTVSKHLYKESYEIMKRLNGEYEKRSSIILYK